MDRDWLTAKTADQTEPPPPLPHHALGPDCARPPKFGSLDGLAVRWRGWEAWALYYDGRWHETNAADVVTKAWVLTEEAYHRLHPNVPPLPDEAFRDDWSSPLI